MIIDNRYRVMMEMMCAEIKPTQREMAKALGISPGSIQDRIAEMVKSGLLTNPHGKARYWVLTERGKKRLADAQRGKS